MDIQVISCKFLVLPITERNSRNMNVLDLSRIQFAFTAAFHYLFPPMSIGLALLLVVMEGWYLKTKNPVYEQMTRFWVKVFGLIFAVGVASGIVLEFQFGTNWSTYSRFVGDVFGSALAAEALFAFFLESGFLAILLFGWDRVKPRIHFLSTVMVALGAHFSAVWIIVANSWMQTPAGHHMVMKDGVMRAEIVDFWQLVFNPSFVDRLVHVYASAWMTGAFLVLGVSAYYLVKRRHVEFARTSLKLGLVAAAIFCLFQVGTGHMSAMGVCENQPAKMAACEGHYQEGPADMYLVGWVDEKEERVRMGIKIPGLLGLFIYGDPTKAVTGLKNFKPEDRPPVNLVFQSYHIMIILCMAMIAVAWGGLFLWWRGRLWQSKWPLWIFVWSALAPPIANQTGWIAAEVGRQPYIVYPHQIEGVTYALRTSAAFSPTLTTAQAFTSLALFIAVYTLLLAVFLFLLYDKIQKGPAVATLPATGKEEKP